MHTAPPLVSDPSLPFSFEWRKRHGLSSYPPNLVHSRSFSRFRFPQISSWAIKKRKRNGFGRSSKIMLESACVIASKIGLLPAPLALLVREFGGGNGGGNGGFWDVFGSGDTDGWKRRRKTRMGVVGVLLICCLGLWVVLGKEMAIDVDLLLGVLGLLLFGLSVHGWRKGIKDWILGFCCCAFLGCLVLKREDFRTWVKWFGTVNKSERRKRRVF